MGLILSIDHPIEAIHVQECSYDAMESNSILFSSGFSLHMTAAAFYFNLAVCAVFPS
jgi:hypothetical protein